MSKTKPNTFEGRTKEWDSNEWQGRRKRQVDNNELVSAVGVVVSVLVVIGMIMYNFIQ
jgi:uncharacterized membrane protein YidH (DUF202 family)